MYQYGYAFPPVGNVPVFLYVSLVNAQEVVLTRLQLDKTQSCIFAYNTKAVNSGSSQNTFITVGPSKSAMLYK